MLIYYGYNSLQHVHVKCSKLKPKDFSTFMADSHKPLVIATSDGSLRSWVVSPSRHLFSAYSSVITTASPVSLKGGQSGALGITAIAKSTSFGNVYLDKKRVQHSSRMSIEDVNDSSTNALTSPKEKLHCEENNEVQALKHRIDKQEQMLKEIQGCVYNLGSDMVQCSQAVLKAKNEVIGTRSTIESALKETHLALQQQRLVLHQQKELLQNQWQYVSWRDLACLGIALICANTGPLSLLFNTTVNRLPTKYRYRWRIFLRVLYILIIYVGLQKIEKHTSFCRRLRRMYARLSFNTHHS